MRYLNKVRKRSIEALIQPKQLISPTVKFRFILILSLVSLCSIANAQVLSGQVFILSEQYDENQCEIIAPCDCCATDLFFLTDKDFAMINRCLFNDTYYKGTYSIGQGKLTLTFKEKNVRELVDEQTNKITNEMENTKIEPYVFSVDVCKKNIHLSHLTVKDFSHGLRYTTEKEKELKIKLYKTEAWRLISK